MMRDCFMFHQTFRAHALPQLISAGSTINCRCWCYWRIASLQFLSRIVRERALDAVTIAVQFDDLSTFVSDATPPTQKRMVSEQRRGDFEAVETRHVTIRLDTMQVKRGGAVHKGKTARAPTARPTHCVNQSRQTDSAC